MSSQPVIYSISDIPTGIQELLKQEQELIQSVIEVGVGADQTSAYSALQDRLDTLKASIPSAKTSSGHVESTRYYKRSYISRKHSLDQL